MKKKLIFVVVIILIWSLLPSFPFSKASGEIIWSPPYEGSYIDNDDGGEAYWGGKIEHGSSSSEDGFGWAWAISESPPPPWSLWGEASAFAYFYISEQWVAESSGQYEISFVARVDGWMGTFFVEPAISPTALAGYISLLLAMLPKGDADFEGTLKLVMGVIDVTEFQQVFFDEVVLFQSSEEWWYALAEKIPIHLTGAFFGGRRLDFDPEIGYFLEYPLELKKGHEYRWVFWVDVRTFAKSWGIAGAYSGGSVRVQLDYVMLKPVSVYKLDVIASAPESVEILDVFSVTANVHNVNGGDIHNVIAELHLPSGLSLISGDNPQNLGTIPSGGSASASWSVSGDSDGSWVLGVEAWCDEGAIDINHRTVDVIPPPPTYELDVTARAPNTVIEGEEFTVIGQVENKEGGVIHNVVATLELSSGLSLVSGSNPQNLGTINLDDHENATWIVRADLDGTQTLEVDATCDEGATDVDYETISVYDQPSLSVDIYVSNTAMEGVPFRIEALIQNKGDITIHNVISTINVPTGLTLVYTDSHPNPAFEDKILPGSDTTPVWYAQGVVGSYTISVDVTSDEGSVGYGETNVAVVGALQEAFLLWSYPTGNDARGVACGDLDGDGIDDVAASSLDGKIYAIKSDGTELWNYTTGGMVVSVAVGDVDGDGICEVFGGGYEGYLYCISGKNGTIITGWPKWAGGDHTHPIFDIQVGDFDGDGKQDAAASTTGFGDVYSFRGYDGYQFFRCTHTDDVRDIGVGDINGDGKDDVAVGVWSIPGEVYAYRGYDGAKLWGPYIIDDEARTVDVGDLNGDGKGDVVVGMNFDAVLDEVYAISSSGSLMWDTNLWRVGDVKVSDLDGDGDNDVAVGTIHVYQETIAFLDGNDGSIIMSIGLEDRINSIDVGDLDGDGINDIAAGGDYGNVWAIKSSGPILWNYSCGDIYLHQICVGDVSGDGVDEVIAGSFDNNVYALASVPPDEIGPITGFIEVSPNMTNSDPIVCAKIIDDFSDVATAEYFIDSTGISGTGTIMSPQDGDFDSGFENATAVIDILGLGEGLHTAYIHGKDSAGNWGDFNNATFVVDRVPPVITILSPHNITYTQRLMDLNVTANEPIDVWMFSLNGGSNFTFTPNVMISAGIGTNELAVYANDTAGNMEVQQVTWTRKLSTAINCSLHASTIQLGNDVIITCMLNYPLSEGNVTLQYSTNQTSWIDLLSGTPIAGTFEGNWTPTTTGILFVRCIWSGSIFYAGSTSSTQTLNVLVPSDINVTNLILSKTITGQGYNCKINVSVANEGNFIETFNVTAYADLNPIIIGDEITIGTQNITLASGNSTVITFTWNTTGTSLGNYTISAYATPIFGETDTEDNTFTNGEIKVGIPGDVNGDGIVNYEDIYTELVLRFMCYSTDPCYSANSDIDCNGRINYQDIYIAIIHFMETEP